MWKPGSWNCRVSVKCFLRRTPISIIYHRLTLFKALQLTWLDTHNIRDDLQTDFSKALQLTWLDTRNIQDDFSQSSRSARRALSSDSLTQVPSSETRSPLEKKTILTPPTILPIIDQTYCSKAMQEKCTQVLLNMSNGKRESFPLNYLIYTIMQGKNIPMHWPNKLNILFP